MERIEQPKSKKNQKIWRKRKLQVLENIGSGCYQTNGGERKNNKSTSEEREHFLRLISKAEASSKEYTPELSF